MKLNMQRATTALAALVLLLSTAGCNRLQSRDNLNKGVREYKSAKYAEAVKFFQKAIELDPDFTTARLYLATAYMSQWIPGAALTAPGNNIGDSAQQRNIEGVGVKSGGAIVINATVVNGELVIQMNAPPGRSTYLTGAILEPAANNNKNFR